MDFVFSAYLYTAVKWKRLRLEHKIHTDPWLEIPWNETTSDPEGD